MKILNYFLFGMMSLSTCFGDGGDGYLTINNKTALTLEFPNGVTGYSGQDRQCSRNVPVNPIGPYSSQIITFSQKGWTDCIYGSETLMLILR